jgi:hypothetical protein
MDHSVDKIANQAPARWRWQIANGPSNRNDSRCLVEKEVNSLSASERERDFALNSDWPGMLKLSALRPKPRASRPSASVGKTWYGPGTRPIGSSRTHVYVEPSVRSLQGPWVRFLRSGNIFARSNQGTLQCAIRNLHAQHATSFARARYASQNPTPQVRSGLSAQSPLCASRCCTA